MNYPEFAETSTAAIVMNRAARYRDKKHITSLWLDGRHTDSWQSRTYDRTAAESARLAEAWRKLGVRPGDRVAIAGKNRPRWVMTFAGLLVSNVTVVPIYPSLTAREVAFILKDSGAKYAVADTLDQAKKIASIAGQCPELKKIFVMDSIEGGGSDMIGAYDDLLGMSSQKPDFDPVTECIKKIGRDDVVVLIYTSGTTGRPKGVMLTNGNLMSQRVMMPAFSFSSGDIFLNHLPLCHAFGLSGDLAASLDAGAEMVIADGIGTEQIRFAMTTIRPTVLMSVPRLYEKLFVEVKRVVSSRPAPVQALFREALDTGKQVFDLRNEDKPIPMGLKLKYAVAKKILSAVRQKAGLDRVRVAFAGGGPTSRELCYFFQSLGIDIYQGYGLTETSPIANVNIPGKNKMGTVGPPMPGVEERIAEDGEILIRGPNLMRGYWNNPEATREAIDSDGWFHSGDIGFIDSDGYLTITDRKKELIVTAGGKNVAPLAIETAYNTEKYIERVVVIGDRRKYLAALVIPNFDLVAGWAEKRDIKWGSSAELAANPKVVRLMENRVEEVNKQFARHEQIKKIAVMDHEFSEATGEITPTQKLRRRVIEQKYRDVIEKMYPKEETPE